MELLHQLLQALWHQDFQVLSNPSLLWAVYGVLFLTLFLENGLLPASFLPGDSLLLLSGALIAKGALSLSLTLLVLISAAALGCWLSYLQGRWLGNTQTVKRWMSQLPEHYHERARRLFIRHGLFALLFSRFLAFVRTLLPTVAGLSGLNAFRFQIFNWLSAVVWVGCLVGLGYAISITPIFKRYENLMMQMLMILPIVLLIIGLVGALIVIVRKRYAKS